MTAANHCDNCGTSANVEWREDEQEYHCTACNDTW